MPVLEKDSRVEKLIYDMNAISNEISRKEWEFAKKLQTLYNLMRLENPSPFPCENRSCPIPKITESVLELVNSYDEVLDERGELRKAKLAFHDLVAVTDDEAEEADDELDQNKPLSSTKMKKEHKRKELERKKRILVVDATSSVTNND